MENLWHWLSYSPELIQRFCVVVVAAVISTRWRWLRLALQAESMKPSHTALASLAFGVLAVIGTHSGIVIDIQQLQREPLHLRATLLNGHLLETQAIVGFRDTMTMMAGLIGGPWVGLGAGLIAGLERIYLGGFAGAASGWGTLLLGVYAGCIRHFRPEWTRTSWHVLTIAFVGSLLQRAVILVLVKPFSEAMLLSTEIIFHVIIINCVGCLLFYWVMCDLEKGRLENEAQEAKLLAEQASLDAKKASDLAKEWEFQALLARTDPHFLNGALNYLNALIYSNRDQATLYVSELADFFRYTRLFSENKTISLHEELEQLRRYFKLQRLCLTDKLQETIDVPEGLLGIRVLPGCLLTLVENALTHAFVQRSPPYRIDISAKEDSEGLVLTVTDNGRGLVGDCLEKIGKEPVNSSASRGCGVALYSLKQNLDLVFNNNARLIFSSAITGGTQASIYQPSGVQ